MIKTTVFTNGCFDVLHVGHFNLLMYCAKLAGPDGQIVMAIDSDEKIKKDKGVTRPFFTADERRKTLLSLDLPIAEVWTFDTNEELLRHIDTIRPDYIVKGEDWKGNVVGSDVPKVKVKLYPMTTNQSTSTIARRVVQRTLENDFKKEIPNAKIDPFDRLEEK